jgi:hypothetical protein
MLSRTTHAARTFSRRAFATAVDAGAGVRVAAADADAPTASVTLFVKAGTRYEGKAGAANALKHFAFKVSQPKFRFGVFALDTCSLRPSLGTGLEGWRKTAAYWNKRRNEQSADEGFYRARRTAVHSVRSARRSCMAAC